MRQAGNGATTLPSPRRYHVQFPPLRFGLVSSPRCSAQDSRTAGPVLGDQKNSSEFWLLGTCLRQQQVMGR